MAGSEATIAAVHSGALGDLVLFGRLLSELDGPVTLITGGEKGGLLAGLGAVERSLDFDSLPMHEVFTDEAPDRCRLPALLGKHDRLVSCFATGDRRAELRLAALCGAGDAAFLPIRPDEASDAHLLDVWRDLLGLSNSACGRPESPFTVPSQWRDEAGSALGENAASQNRPLVVIHPGAGAPEKCWPVNRFLALGRSLANQGPSARAVGVVFVLGPVECERWPAEHLDELREGSAVIESPPPTMLAGLLDLAAAYVGNDSGVSHLAAAVGTPTVALFGPSRPEHFAPRGRDVTILATATLDDIRVEDVSRAVVQLLPVREQ